MDATKSGSPCTQLRPKVAIPEGLSPPAVAYAGGIHAVDDDSEDCKCPSVFPPNPVFDGRCAPVSGLTLDVIKPAVIDPDVKLPVAVVGASRP